MSVSRRLKVVGCAVVGCMVAACGGSAVDVDRIPTASAQAAGRAAPTASAQAAGRAGPTAGVAVASDSTGLNLVVLGTDVWTSTDRGTTWTNQTPSGPAHNHSWTSVASDSTGMKLVAVVNGSIDADPDPDLEVQDGDIWTSTNGGVTWTDQTPSGPAHGQAWFSVASDSTGTNLVALAASQGVLGPGSIWTSTNGGAAWTDQTVGIAAMQHLGWKSVASDSTGTKLVAVAGGGDIWTSTNGGVTWTDRTTSGPAHGNPSFLGGWGWNSVASDSTGDHLVAVVDTGDIWTSSDAGVTWTDQTSSGPASNQVWFSVASDATGTNLIAVDGLVTGNNGDVWTSSNRGATWTDQTTGNAALSEVWLAVASNATGTSVVALQPKGVWVN